MPLIPSSYDPRGWYRSYHLSTIYSAVFRRIHVRQERERFWLQDGDYLDLDWTRASQPTRQLVLITHGLAGSASRPYVKGMAKIFSENNWDVVGMNFRGCSGEMNRHYASYHAGATDDLHEVLEMLVRRDSYDRISLIGFSLGGNMILKYLSGRRELPEHLYKAVAISAPCDLHGALQQLMRPRNLLYAKRFLYRLKKDLQCRASRFPGHIEPQRVRKISSLLEFDQLYTSRAHGFRSAQQYYEKSSSRGLLPNLQLPVLLLNAANDGFLSADCYPRLLAQDNPRLFLEIPQFGGHVGFLRPNGPSYAETRALDFLSGL